MKRRAVVLFVLVLLVLPLSGVLADTGVGVILGDPTGLSLLFGNRIAVGSAWDLDNYIHVHADVWLAHRVLAEPINWYAGMGGKLLVFFSGGGTPFRDNPDAAVGLGIRIPVGIQWYPIDNLEVFLEGAPGLFLIPATDVDVDLGIGVRYHF